MSNKRVYKSEVSAKINLSLEIAGKVEGLHTLRMLVCPYGEYKDVVEFYPESGEGITDIDILASFVGFDKARFLDFYKPKAESIAKRFGVGGRIVVKKNVPLGAGLGGSTASIVGTIKAISEYADSLGKSTALDDGFLLSLGSDVPCMLYGKPCLVCGVGEIVKPVDISVATSDLRVEIAEGGSDTKACYALYDRLKAENPDIDTAKCDGAYFADTDSAEFIDVDGEKIRLYRNDLTLPATMLNKNIQKLILKLENDNKFAFMSGSGSAVVFKTYKF